MDVTWVAFVVGLLVSMAAWFVFLWAIRDGQFKDPEGTARAMLEGEIGREARRPAENERTRDG